MKARIYVCLMPVCISAPMQGVYFSHVLTLCDAMDCSPARFLCPWDSPGKNTGVGCHFHLQGIFPTSELNPGLFCLLHWQAGSLPLAPPRKSPVCNQYSIKNMWNGLTSKFTDTGSTIYYQATFSKSVSEVYSTSIKLGW